MKPFAHFLQYDSAPGIVLCLSGLGGLIMANTAAAAHYSNLQALIQHPVNDWLMVVFFLLVGIEIRHELTHGHLNTRRQALLPLIAAIGGVMLPMVIYWLFNPAPPHSQGLAIPAATDIAFALGVIALMGKKVPVSLKIFLMAVAVIDDLVAMIIIGLFYAGLHFTVVGAGIGAALPAKIGNGLMKKLKPVTDFFILPVFAFINAGIALNGFNMGQGHWHVAAGVAVGLFLGKQLGVFGFAWLAIKLRVGKLPAEASWWQLYGVCMLAGIGFTMSLFINGLALPLELQEHAKLGVLLGSALSGLCGYAMLHGCARR